MLPIEDVKKMPKKKLVDPVEERFNKNTIARLKKHGEYGEILDEILNRMLDYVEARKK